MRIISQDGCYDFNYDLISLWVEYEGEHWAICAGMLRGYTEVAQYSSEEKAMRALDDLHEAYMNVRRQVEKSGLIHYDNLPLVWKFPHDFVMEG